MISTMIVEQFYRHHLFVSFKIITIMLLSMINGDYESFARSSLFTYFRPIADFNYWLIPIDNDYPKILGIYTNMIIAGSPLCRSLPAREFSTHKRIDRDWRWMGEIMCDCHDDNYYDYFYGWVWLLRWQ